MSAVDEYEIHKGDMTLQEMHRADAALAEGEAENERLRRAYNELHREWVRTLGRAKRAEGAGAMKECIECGPWCPVFNPKGVCVARDPGEHCAICLAARIELQSTYSHVDPQTMDRVRDIIAAIL